MEKVNKLIKLLNEGNEEVRNFLLIMSEDPEIEVNMCNGNITVSTPEGFEDRFNKKVDDLLAKYQG